MQNSILTHKNLQNACFSLWTASFFSVALKTFFCYADDFFVIW